MLGCLARASSLRWPKSRTAYTGTMVVGVSPGDLEIALRLVSTSPGYLSKWTKLELVSAAIALRLFVRELPGGPKLLRRAMDLAKSSNGSEDERMARAVKAIARQDGVDASLYRPTQEAGGAPTATSTQAPTGGLLTADWDDLSQIPPNQQGLDDGGGVGGGGEEEVSDPGSSNAPSLAAPVQLANGPHNGTDADVVGDGLVDASVNGSGVALGGGVGVQNAVGSSRKGGPSGAGGNNTVRICNKVWKGRNCNRRDTCNFAHPTICNNSGCNSGDARGACSAFHPPARAGNGRGGARRGNSASTRQKPNGKARTGGSSGGSSSSSSGGSGGYNNNNNRRSGNGRNNPHKPTYLQLQEKVANMKLEISRHRERGARRELRELKEMTVSGTTNSSTYAQRAAKAVNNDHSAPVRPPQELVDVVVKAVMAAIGEARQRHCRC